MSLSMFTPRSKKGTTADELGVRSGHTQRPKRSFDFESMAGATRRRPRRALAFAFGS